MKKYFRLDNTSPLHKEVTIIINARLLHFKWLKKIMDKSEIGKIIVNNEYMPRIIGFQSEYKPDGFKKVSKVDGENVYYPKVGNKEHVDKLIPNHKIYHDLEFSKLVNFQVQFSSEMTFHRIPFATIFKDHIYIYMDKYLKYEPLDSMTEIKEWEFLKMVDEEKEVK